MDTSSPCSQYFPPAIKLLALMSDSWWFEHECWQCVSVTHLLAAAWDDLGSFESVLWRQKSVVWFALYHVKCFVVLRQALQCAMNQTHGVHMRSCIAATSGTNCRLFPGRYSHGICINSCKTHQHGSGEPLDNANTKKPFYTTRWWMMSGENIMHSFDSADVHHSKSDTNLQNTARWAHQV